MISRIILPTINPPEYSGIENNDIQSSSRQNSIHSEAHSRPTSPTNIEMLPLPLPTYELVSESEDEWFPVNHSSPPRVSTASPTKTNLLGVSGCPPSYEAVTSEGSDTEIIGHRGQASVPHEEPMRNKARTSRSKRTSSSSIRNALNNHDSDSDNEEDKNERRAGEPKRKRSSNSSTNSVETPVDLSELPVIDSDSEGELEEVQVVPTDHLQPKNKNEHANARPSSSVFLTIPKVEIGEVHHPGNSVSLESNRKFKRSRSYTDLARHAIHNSLGRTSGASTPELHRQRAKSMNNHCLLYTSPSPRDS